LPHAQGFKPLGTPFIELQSVDSTNNYARQQIEASGMPAKLGESLHGRVYFSYEQLAGRGQMGKNWSSEKRKNITLSIIVDPVSLLLTKGPFFFPEQFHLSACMSLGLRNWFAKYAGGDTRIKWPNDLYWQDRKAGGILIEVIGNTQYAMGGQPATGNRQYTMRTQEAMGGPWAIVGIGVNINQTKFPEELPNPVSLKQITGKDFDPLELAKELCRYLNETFIDLNRVGFPILLSSYNSHLYKKNKMVRFKKENRIFEAEILEVTLPEKLKVEHAMVEEFDFGSVEWLLK
jgi:BirA family biotin operon repressor/biotin-[acetyl-CoA-carboxylase] ligase